MKKILKYSTIIGAAALISSSAIADTGGYVRVKGFDSHFHSLGFNQLGCNKSGAVQSAAPAGTDCKFASEQSDITGSNGTDQNISLRRDNELRWAKDDGEGIVAGADFGFFRLEVEGTYQDGKATQWRGYTADGGTVYQARLFGNIVVEPFDLLELLGEFGGIDPLVTYNPAHYGISPYAMYGYGVMGGLLTNLNYTKHGSVNSRGTAVESGAFGGGATAAVNVGAGVNIGLDKLARSFAGATGATVPEYFKLPIEFSVGYHWQVGLDDLLFESMDEKLGIDDGGLTYSVGLRW